MRAGVDASFRRPLRRQRQHDLPRANERHGVWGGGTSTGAQLSYNAPGWLAAWQNAPGGSSTSSDSFLYDGEGTRVAQQTVVGGTTTTTVYVGDLEEVATSGSTTTTTTYYYAASQRIALAVNGVFSYLGNDGLGSASVALSATGVSQGSALYMPFGGGRWGSGTMPTQRLFTGQLSDAVTSLDYFGGRYYDPALGQFASADTYDAGGLNRYAYVDDNPTSRTDPSGHCPWCALAFVAVGLAIASTTVVSAYVSGNLTAGTWARAGADVALGAAAAVAVAVNPVGAGLGAAGAGIGVIGQLVAGQQVDLQSAFESVAVGAVTGAVGGELAGSLLSTGAKTATAVGVRILAQGLGQAGISVAGDWTQQQVNHLDATVDGKHWNYDGAETAQAGKWSGIGGTLSQFLGGWKPITKEAGQWIGGGIQFLGNAIAGGQAGYDYRNHLLEEEHQGHHTRGYQA